MPQRLLYALANTCPTKEFYTIGGLTALEVKLVANGENNPDGMATLSRSAELLLKLKIHELKGDRSQSEMILLLDSLGFKSGEIIRLLGATAGTVRPILSRGRKKKKKG